MYSVFSKEISAFFSSLTGYITVTIFLFAIAWFMWLSPGDLNVLDSGYANIDTLFFIAPWVFLFLVPAATMRSFSEEKRLGTLELLLTRPITDWQLVLGKYLAAVVLILLSLLPCLIFLESVYHLADPVGNVDMGGFWGSFIGLFLLASCYAAVGVFASAITENQLVAFILAATFCFVLLIGFDGLSELPLFKSIDRQVQLLGINEHYKSIRRGIIDSRDVLYFLSVATVFLSATVLKLQSRGR